MDNYRSGLFIQWNRKYEVGGVHFQNKLFSIFAFLFELSFEVF